MALIAAFMTRPDVLLLDEPTAGLDPLMEAEFQALARGCRSGADHLSVVASARRGGGPVSAGRDPRAGRLVEVAALEDLRPLDTSVFDVTMDGPPTLLDGVPGVADVQPLPDGVRVTATGSPAQLARLGSLPVSRLRSRQTTLEEIFLTYYEEPAGIVARCDDQQGQVMSGGRVHRGTGRDREGPASLGARVLSLSARLLRRSTVVAWLATAAYLVAEVYGFERTYPDTASRQQLAAFADSPAVRMLQGVPRAVDTTGGYVVWDGGWVLALGLAIWALLAVTRLLRAEEESGRAELVLAAPIRSTTAVATQLLMLAASIGSVGAVVAVTMASLGTGTRSSLLLGLGLAGLAATVGGLAAVTAQCFAVRRQAGGVALGRSGCSSLSGWRRMAPTAGAGCAG